MVTRPSMMEPTWIHVRQKAPPLYQMPHEWQPKLNMPSPYHSSHCDRGKAGWLKWGHDYPDFHARTAVATEPEWFTRRVNDVHTSNINHLLWPYERTQKPTEKRMYGIAREPPRPVQRGNYIGVPHDIEGSVMTPNFGRYHAEHFEYPSRPLAHLPAIHADEKHL